MGEKVTIDFPAFITRDSESMWLLVGDDSHVLLSNTVIAEIYRQLYAALGYKDTMHIMYESALKGAHVVQRGITKDYRLSIKDEDALSRRIARIPFYIQTFGHGRGKTVAKGQEFVFQVKHSAIAFAVKDIKPVGPVCSFLAGFFAGMAEVYADLLKPTRYTCVETKCAALGDPVCEFKLSPTKE